MDAPFQPVAHTESATTTENAVAPATTSATASGRIGPNAILRLIEAVEAQEGAAAAAELLNQAGLSYHRNQLPQDMVDEKEVASLHTALSVRFPRPHAIMLAHRAGVATAEYLLANRIPRMAQPIIKLLPTSLGLKTLVKSMAGHAWTFAGSAEFAHDAKLPGRLSLSGGLYETSPTTAETMTTFYTATFQTLFDALMRSSIRVTPKIDGTTCIFALNRS